MNLKNYVACHPISYWSIVASFGLVFIVSTCLWALVILDIQADYFGEMLSEQKALKWLWLLASASLLFLSARIVIGGPIEDYDNVWVKIFGIYLGNGAVAAAAAYSGILWGSVIPSVIFKQPLINEMTTFDLIYVCTVCLLQVIGLYMFYLVLFVNSKVSEYFKTDTHKAIIRFLVGAFCVVFFLGRVFDIIKIFQPHLF